jgi:hypothetical protein
MHGRAVQSQLYLQDGCSCKAVKAGVLNDIELAWDVVATERGACRGTLIGGERNTILKGYVTTI